MISGLQLLLGGALVIEKEYAEGEKLLIKGYREWAPRLKDFPQGSCRHVADAVDRLILLYIKTNKPDEVKKWRAERAKYLPERAPAPRAIK